MMLDSRMYVHNRRRVKLRVRWGCRTLAIFVHHAKAWLCATEGKGLRRERRGWLT
jgi:hypothetical protein